MMPTLSSLLSTEVVVWTTLGADNDDNMTIIGFQ